MSRLSGQIIAVLMLLVTTGSQGGELKPAEGLAPDGIKYAFDQFRKVTQAPVELYVGDAEVDKGGLAHLGPESFAIQPKDGGYRITGARPPGVMYGLLELRERIQRKQAPVRKIVSSPALRVRGHHVDFPFYLGVDLYNGRWRRHEDVEDRQDWWWFEKGHWQWRLQRCAELRMNALLLCHPHPFPALIDLPGMPEAAYFDETHLRQLQNQFSWILRQAEQYGVRIYLLTQNIWVSPGFARAHNIEQSGVDTPLVRDYNRACYRRLFETYPKLAGLMTIAGEAPPGCVDFVRDAVVGGLNELPEPPQLLYWLWCSYPEDARRIIAAYEGPVTPVHYLQYEQLFRPQADPRIKMTSEALGGVEVLTLGGLGTATGWLYWSDPYYIRDIIADLGRQKGAGVFFQGLDSFGWVAKKWLGWQGLARYWWNPRPGREDDYWHWRIERKYGVQRAAPDLLQAAIDASRITTRLLAQLHRQTDHFMPQFGLPLIHYLGLPTLSTYIYENHHTIDAQGRLAPRRGLTWPNPDWGEKVIGVIDWVEGRRDGTGPPQIADELQTMASSVLERTERLMKVGEQATCGPEQWRKKIMQMRMNGYLGLHTAHKLRAAVAWRKWRRGKAAPRPVYEHLQQSVQAMEKMAAVAADLYPGIRMHAWRSCISRPVPWTNLQIWRTDRHREHTFSQSAAMFRRELHWVKREIDADYHPPLLPFEQDLAAPPAEAELLVRWDFSGDAPVGVRINDFPPDAIAEIADTGAPPPLTGERLVSTSNADDFYFPLTTDPEQLPLQIGKHYRVCMDYWVVEDAEELGDWLSAGARTSAGGWREDIGRRYMGGPTGTRGRITLSFSPGKWQDYYIYVSIHGKAKIEIDNLEIWQGEPPNASIQNG